MRHRAESNYFMDREAIVRPGRCVPLLISMVNTHVFKIRLYQGLEYLPHLSRSFFEKEDDPGLCIRTMRATILLIIHQDLT